MQIAVNISGFNQAYAFESVVAGVAAAGLTATNYIRTGSEAARDLGNARMVMIQVEGRIRYRLDGGAATGAVGHILNDGDILTLAAMQQFKNFSAIREANETTDATLRVTYFR